MVTCVICGAEAIERFDRCEKHTSTYLAAGPTIKRFHDCDKFVKGLMGPFGCVAPDTLIVTERGVLPIADITEPMRVLSWNEKTYQFELSLCGGAYPKGKDYLYRVSTPNGEFESTGHHQIFGAEHGYQRVDTLSPGQFLPQCSLDQISTISEAPLTSHGDGRHSLQRYADLMDRYAELARQYGQQLLSEASNALSPFPLSLDAPGFSRLFDQAGLLHEGDRREQKYTHSQQYLFDGHLQTDDSCPQASLLPQDGQDHTFARFFSHTSERVRQYWQPLWRFLSHHKDQLQRGYSHSYSNPLSKRTIISIERLPYKQEYWDMQVLDTNNYVTVDGTIHHNSAKSVACCFELYFNAMMQHKQKDGIRRSRYAVVRNTYSQLQDTTISTWMDWFGEFGDPAHGTDGLKISNNTFILKYGEVEMELRFRALDKPEDVKKLLSAEYTGAWINEVKEVPKAIFEGVTGRVNRFPSPKNGGCVEPRVILDTNPPDDDSWLYQLFEVDLHKDQQLAENYAWFKQPPGIVKIDGRWEENWGQVDGIPQAENIQNLSKNYYHFLTIGKSDEWRKVYAEGKYGFVQDGKAVFSQYNDDIHCVKFEADPELPIYIGLDAGLTPACVLAQLSKRGQLRVIDELSVKDMGMYQFARDIIKPYLATEYPGFKINEVAWGDPAKTRGEAAEQSAIGMLNDMYIEESDDEDGVVQMPLDMPFTTIPAPGGNVLDVRLDAVNSYLTRLIDGAPAFLLHPKCSGLRKGFLGRYRFERVQVSGDDRYKELPKKNHPYSDLQDGLQNICKGTMGETEVDDDYFEEYQEQATSWSGR